MSDAGIQRVTDFLSMLEQESRANESARAKADPKANKLTRVFDGAVRYRYYETRNVRGGKVRFAWSTVKNAAGFFLTWREVETKDGERVKRDQWRASKGRITMCRVAWKRYAAQCKHVGDPVKWKEPQRRKMSEATRAALAERMAKARDANPRTAMKG